MQDISYYFMLSTTIMTSYSWIDEVLMKIS